MNPRRTKSLLVHLSTLILLTTACGKDDPTEPPTPPPGGGGTAGSGILYASSRDGNLEIYRMDPNGANSTRLTTDPRRDGDPVWSPDGKRIAFTRAIEPSRTWEIYVMDADGSDTTRLTNNISDDTNPRWSPDGTRIAYLAGAALTIMNADGSSKTVVGSGISASEMDWTRDGTRLLYTNAFGTYTVDANGANPDTLANGGTNPAFSPNGSRIAVVRRPGLDFEIYVMSADGSDTTRVTNSPGLDLLPRWSPDGTKLAWTSIRDGNLQVWTMNVDGSNPVRVSSPPGEDYVGSWR